MNTRTRFNIQDILTNAFYQAPKFLNQGEFRKLSSDAKWLYTMLLDRNRLSIKNSWADANGDVYIIYQREHMAEDIGKSRNTITKIVNELKEFGLVEEIAQGHNRPNKIYVQTPIFTTENLFDPEAVADFANEQHEIAEVIQQQNQMKNISQSAQTLDAQNLCIQTPNICASGRTEFVHRDAQNLTPSNNNINNNNYSNTYPIQSYQPQHHQIQKTDGNGMDGFANMDAVHVYRKIIEDNIEYEYLLDNYEHEHGRINEMIDLILETVCTQAHTICIAKADHPAELVKSKFLKLTSCHIEYVIDSMQKNTTEIRNIKKYLLAALFNAPSTMSNYYASLFQHNNATKSQQKTQQPQQKSSIQSHNTGCETLEHLDRELRQQQLDKYANTPLPRGAHVQNPNI